MESRSLSLLALIAALSLSVFMQAGSAEALSMGALAKSYSAYANPADVAAFTLLFWNVEDEPYDVELSVDFVPQNWSMILDPKNFTLDSTPLGKAEYIYLPYLKKSIRAKAVDVYVYVPDSTAAGTYLVSAVATVMPGGHRQINFVGQKKFSFEIIVGGVKNTKESTPAGVVIENPGIAETVFSNIEEQRTVTVENPGTFALFSSENATNKGSPGPGRKSFFAAVIVILIIAWVIYRYE